MNIDVSKIIKGFDGKAVLNERLEPVTIKDVLLSYIGTHTPERGDQVVMVCAIGQRLYDCENDFELNDKEYEMMKSIVEKPRSSAVVMKALYEALEIKM